MTTKPSTPSSGARINHLVLSVKDLAASHTFYTEVLGFQRCAILDKERHNLDMYFYRGSADHHHDIALVQVSDPEHAVGRDSWVGFAPTTELGINHIAIGYPSRDSWLAQIQHMQTIGVEFVVRGNHGMTHSAYISDPDGNGLEIVYDVAREQWESDVQAALNHFDLLPGTGPEALLDPPSPVFG